MLPTGRRLQELAQEIGFDVAALEKVVRLAELLEGVERLDELASLLVLKGGTALNLAFGSPSRLSVDLDFNLVGIENRDELLAVRPGVESRLEALARSQGLGIQRSAEAHAGRKLFLSYSRIVDAQPDRIEVDLNYLHRVCLLPPERRTIWRPDAEGPTTTVLSWPEIAAGKLVAFLDRAAPRDAWDISRLPALSPVPWPPADLRSIFIALAGTLPRPLREYGRKGLERVREAEVSRSLWPMLLSAREAERGVVARRMLVRRGASARPHEERDRVLRSPAARRAAPGDPGFRGVRDRRARAPSPCAAVEGGERA